FRVSQYTYLLLQKPEQVKTFQSKLDDFYERNIKTWVAENAPGQDIRFSLQPLESIHFDTDFGYDISPAGNKQYVYIFSFVAVFVLLIACINYMNLSTARSSKRAKEVGMRKVIGAYRSQIIRQFIGESVFMTLIAVVLALALVELSLPFFNELTGKSFNSKYLLQPEFLLALLAILVFVGLVAGSYPAFVLSAFKPVDVLKSDKSPRGSSAVLRKSLVVLQFTISLVMIIGTLVVLLQMNFLKNKDLGFEKEQVLVIDIPGGDTTLVNKLSTIKHEFLQHPNIEKVATSAHIPGEKTGRVIFGVYQKNKEIPVAFNTMWVDYDFMDLMGIELKEGRNFSKETPTDVTQAFIVNEAGAKLLEQNKALGTRMTLGVGPGYDGKVVGVAKDFHYKSLHSEVEPLVLLPTDKSQGYLLARVQAENLPQTISFIEEKWSKFDPKHPMEYFFLDEKFDEQYRAEEKMLAVFGYFAALTIFIACLGLFGLASFTAEQRTKEIGIRKVLGSSVSGIVLLLSKDFAVLVLVAIVLASPVAWYGMHKWLQDFAYRTDISIWIFVFAGLIALLIAMLTVSSQAAKAALRNPVNALRAE
ncbi:MAG: FtsX-like permease family protein, partial [Hymenobacteraceae bacterium]|nr:FtsX-like permease family protein [Hymenobacteraceae bacterium]MDX5513822.1 FtsX-like permease family protein [Hymenobacteraceae bacterium]